MDALSACMSMVEGGLNVDEKEQRVMGWACLSWYLFCGGRKVRKGGVGMREEWRNGSRDDRSQRRLDLASQSTDGAWVGNSPSLENGFAGVRALVRAELGLRQLSKVPRRGIPVF